MIKELSGIVGAYFGKYILERDESLSMQMTKKIYGKITAYYFSLLIEMRISLLSVLFIIIKYLLFSLSYRLIQCSYFNFSLIYLIQNDKGIEYHNFFF